MRTRMAVRIPRKRQLKDLGVSLILVLLTMVVLSLLAATIVFTARSETFASYSYRLDTQADYVAKAGIQTAMNWFRSNHYQAISDSQASTYYNVTQDSSVWKLKTSNTSPVQCSNSSSTKCPTQNATVQLISYGTGSSNFPADLNNSLSTLVTTEFTNNLENVQVSGDPNNFGYFCVNAYLLNYQTVFCPTCAVNPAPMETWLITSQGSWGGTSCTSGTVATAEEQAIIQPVYTPVFGNALYGYCNVTMFGSAGTCTDAYNSALGPYGGGNPSVASGGCDSSSTNVIDAGAGVGGNGFVSLSSNVTVSGNVTIGNVNYNPPSSCCTSSSTPACGYDGSLSSVQGTVINAPPVTAPAVPTFPGSGQTVTFPGSGPGAAPNYNSTTTIPTPLGITCPGGAGCPGAPFDPATNTTLLWPCITGALCNGSKANPFLISSVTLTGGTSKTLTLYGGTDIAHPVYFDIDSLNEAGQGKIAINGYFVLNVKSSMSITGQGILNALTNAPPEAMQINYAGTSSAALGGNGGMSAVVTAPLATVNLGGGGSAGYLVGAVRALSTNDAGGYPIHYDIQLNRVEGTMGQMVISSYSRIKQ